MGGGTRRRLTPKNRTPRTLALLAVALALAGCGDSQPRLERPNIVLVTIDTLRADHLGCYGYFRDTSPNIDAFAKESLVFDQAYAAMATTLPSHASMLTARYPLEHGITANLMHGGKPFGWASGMVSFAQVAKEAGYTTAGFVSAAPLKAPSGIAAGFEVWSEPEGKAVERKAGETLSKTLPWLEQQASQPFFLWVHFYDPHWPHRAPAPYDTLFRGTDAEAKEAWIAERKLPEAAVRSNARKRTETRPALDNYCGEVRYADEQFGVLLEALKRKGVLDSSIVVLTADHGEGLNQHEWTAHGLVWDEQLRVPLVMRFPKAAGVAPGRAGQLVSLIDMLPTVLGRVQPFRTPKWNDFFRLATGVDALASDFEERPVFAQRTGRELAEDPGEMYAITTPRWKFIHEPEVGDQLFDRKGDPHELADLAAKDAAQAKASKREMQLMMELQKRRGAELGPAQAGEADPELLKQMQALGYLGGEDGRNGEPAVPERPAEEPEPEGELEVEPEQPKEQGKRP